MTEAHGLGLGFGSLSCFLIWSSSWRGSGFSLGRSYYGYVCHGGDCCLGHAGHNVQPSANLLVEICHASLLSYYKIHKEGLVYHLRL